MISLSRLVSGKPLSDGFATFFVVFLFFFDGCELSMEHDAPLII
jgi:hypothetical protein